MRNAFRMSAAAVQVLGAAAAIPAAGEIFSENLYNRALGEKPERETQNRATTKTEDAHVKYAILSDVHSNPDALERALEDAREHAAEKVVCLGDVVGYGPDPARAVELVRNSCDVVLMGNHDAAVAGLEDTECYLGSAADGIRRNREQLSEDDLAWLKSLPYVHSEAGFDCAHGSFANADQFRYTQDAFDAKASLRLSEARFQFVGHTHVSAVWDWDECLWDRFPSPVKNGGFVAEPGHRYVVNVGSVGYPRVEAASVYCLFDSSAGSVEFRRLPFDAASYAESLRSHGVEIPHWLENPQGGGWR